MSVVMDAVIELRAKYRWILELRERRLREDVVAPREELTALAGRFPGALRELDEIPLEALRARIEQLDEAEEGADAPVWAAPMWRYHQLLRAALHAKRWLVHDGGEVSCDRLDAAIACGAVNAEAALWREHLLQVANPVRGRLSETVLARVASETGRTLSEARSLALGRGAYL